MTLTPLATTEEPTKVRTEKNKLKSHQEDRLHFCSIRAETTNYYSLVLHFTYKGLVCKI